MSLNQKETSGDGADRERLEMPVDLSRWVGLLVTIIVLFVGAALWASNEHSNLRKDFLHKETISDTYTKKEDFARMEQDLKNAREDLREIKEKLDKLLER